MGQKLPNRFTLTVFILIQILLASSEDRVFRIRKCCAENEIILDRTNECIDYKMLKFDSNIYHHENETNEDPGPVNHGEKNPPPWWFPPNKKILSRKTNQSLEEFPRNFEVLAGKGQPCGILETAFFPIYTDQYDFYDDGSILVYPNKSERFHTSKVELIFDPMSYCLDRLEQETDSYDEGTEPTLDFSDTIDYIIMLCPCTKATCILKCCPPGMLIDMESDQVGESACVQSEPGKNDWAPNYTKVNNNAPDYFLLHRFPICKEDEDTVIPNQFKVDGHTIFSNGSAHIFGETHISQPLEFCGENFITGLGDDKIYNHIIRCYPEVGIKSRKTYFRRILYGILFIIGAFFLFLTLIVHGLLPTRNNINDKNLISQTWSLFIGYLAIAAAQLGNDKLPQSACVFLGFLIQYFFLAAFFWLNVLCFDISWTFSELRIVRGIPNERIHRKFFYYSIYCWALPAVISIVTAVVEFSPDIPDYIIKPQITERCWFRNDSAAILAYFYGPIAILLCINVIFFLYTLFRIYQAQKDISNVIKSTNPEKQRFILYMKLLILMGLPWVAELISWLVGGPDYYWYLTDIINLLRAMFIFVVFCCKKHVLDELKRKFGLMRQPHIRRPSIPRTSSSFFASTQTQDLPKSTNNAVSSL